VYTSLFAQSAATKQENK